MARDSCFKIIDEPVFVADQSSDGVAYLVVREGAAWRDVFRLTPGQVTTIGRAPTNRIVVQDEICSRNHCEVFQSGSHWTIRDLDSRNGTQVNGRAVEADWQLEDGQLIQIGACDLGFTFDITRPFPQFDVDDRFNEETATAMDVVYGDDEVSSFEPEITHRQSDTRFGSSQAAELVGRDRTSRELATLYRLALEMGAATDAAALAEVILSGLFSGSCADIGAILLLDSGAEVAPRPEQLQVAAYRSEGDLPYQKVSDHLSGVVFKEREAVLARDVSDDSRLAARDSRGRIHARSVICAPIRLDSLIFGLIHLYSTNPENPLDPDDLEYTLAVADQTAVALDNLKQKETLAEGLTRVRSENESLREQLELNTELVGDSPTMDRLRENIARVAPTDATVLVRGESGVGKELVARAIHYNSNRRERPYVCMNCAALTESLLESELFGHEKGSFTGATGRKIGKFEQADGGSLFLDEVGEMSLNIQAKFLRVLEGHPYERVGGGRAIEVDVRVVAATNRELEKAVKAGAFRKDLYFRLQVVEVVVEPLRRHRTDVGVLAEHFLARFARKANRPVKKFSAAALETLMEYDWPGNIRELQNAVERAVILCSGEIIEPDDVQLSALGRIETPSQAANRTRGYREISLELLEQEHILATLDRTDWNKSRAAQILGIERSTLDRKLKRYDVSRPKGK